MSKLIIDYKIIGAMLTIAGMLISALFFVYSVRADVDNAIVRVNVLEQRTRELDVTLRAIEQNVAVIQEQNKQIKEDVKFIKDKVE